MQPAILVYLYSRSSESLETIPPLHRNELLVPPVMTNRLPWVRGYFWTLKNVPLEGWDILPRHTFRSSMPPFYVDEYGNAAPEPDVPVERYGLHSFRTLDDLISDALEIERATGD